MKDVKSDTFIMLMSWSNSIMRSIKFDVLTILIKIIFTLSFLCSDDVFLK